MEPSFLPFSQRHRIGVHSKKNLWLGLPSTYWVLITLKLSATTGNFKLENWHALVANLQQRLPGAHLSGSDDEQGVKSKNNKLNFSIFKAFKESNAVDVQRISGSSSQMSGTCEFRPAASKRTEFCSHEKIFIFEGSKNLRSSTSLQMTDQLAPHYCQRMFLSKIYFRNSLFLR